MVLLAVSVSSSSSLVIIFCNTITVQMTDLLRNWQWRIWEIHLKQETIQHNYYMATMARSLWLAAKWARLSCNDQALLARFPRHIQSVFNLIVDILMDIRVMVNWQLSSWPVSHNCIVGSSVRSGVFFELIHGEMSDVTVYLIPQLGHKARERQITVKEQDKRGRKNLQF